MNAVKRKVWSSGASGGWYVLKRPRVIWTRIFRSRAKKLGTRQPCSIAETIGLILRAAFTALTIYFFVVSVIVIGLIVYSAVTLNKTGSIETGAEPTTAAVPSATPQPSGQVVGQVRNVLGDPVAGARVYLAGMMKRTGPRGEFLFENVPQGSRTLRIEAESYRPLELNLLVDEGVNKPMIKYETGLWPASFMVDFHLYTNQRNGRTLLFGEVGFANGSDEEHFIYDVYITAPDGQIIVDMLENIDDYREFAGTYTDSNFTTENRPAAILHPRTVLRKEVPPQSGFARGTYRLTVVHATKSGRNADEQQSTVLTTVPVPDPDWDPHYP